MRQFGFVLVVAAASLAGCGRTALGFDDEETGSETGESTEETGSETTDTGEESSESTDEATFLPSESESETGPESLTCREMLECILECLGSGVGLECLQTCGAGADPGEVAAAGELLFCIGSACIENGQCTLQDFTAPECIECIGISLFLPEPPGCEAEAMACQ